MTRLQQSTPVEQAMELIAQHGLQGMPHVFTLLFNEAMKIERAHALNAQPDQRTESRTGYANGFKPKTVANDLRQVLDASNAQEGQRRLNQLVEKYAHGPRFSAWIEQNFPGAFAVFQLPAQHPKRLRTTHMLERLNKEIRKRTRVVGIFPNEDSLLRLATALAIEHSDPWEAATIVYLDMENA